MWNVGGQSRKVIECMEGIYLALDFCLGVKNLDKELDSLTRADHVLGFFKARKIQIQGGYTTIGTSF